MTYLPILRSFSLFCALLDECRTPFMLQLTGLAAVAFTDHVRVHLASSLRTVSGSVSTSLMSVVVDVGTSSTISSSMQLDLQSPVSGQYARPEEHLFDRQVMLVAPPFVPRHVQS